MKRPDLVQRPDRAAGVFETMLVRDGRVHALDQHLERLGRSVGQLYGLPLPRATPERMMRRAAPLRGEHRLRVDAIPQNGGLELGVASRPVSAGPLRPVALAPVVLPGGLGAHKWRDRRLLHAHGEHPVPLLIDEDGAVLEGAWGNFWLVRGDRLITPPADGRILPGVTRALLLSLAPRIGFRVVEEPIQLADAQTASAAFLTSSVRLAVAAAPAGAPADPDPAIARIRDRLAIF